MFYTHKNEERFCSLNIDTRENTLLGVECMLTKVRDNEESGCIHTLGKWVTPIRL